MLKKRSKDRGKRSRDAWKTKGRWYRLIRESPGQEWERSKPHRERMVPKKEGVPRRWEKEDAPKDQRNAEKRSSTERAKSPCPSVYKWHVLLSFVIYYQQHSPPTNKVSNSHGPWNCKWFSFVTSTITSLTNDSLNDALHMQHSSCPPYQ